MLCQAHLEVVGVTQNQETDTLNPTTLDFLITYCVEGPA
jgi:hypothetical protein